jgi:hypothetical protein
MRKRYEQGGDPSLYNAREMKILAAPEP